MAYSEKLRWISCGLAAFFSLISVAGDPPNLYGFAIPPHFEFDRSPVPGTELWVRKSRRQAFQIARLSDRPSVLKSEAEAKGYLKDLIKIRRKGLIALARKDWNIRRAAYRYDSTRQGFVFDLRGEYTAFTGETLHFIERNFVVGREAYQVLYTEPVGAFSMSSKIEQGLQGFWPTAGAQ